MKYLMIVLALLTTTAFAQEVNRIGKSCQVCIETNNIRVCKYHKVCPIKEEKKE